MIKFIDTLYYFYFKKEEKDFGRNIWSAMSASWCFAVQAIMAFLIVNGALINWEPYANFWFVIPALYVKLLIAFPFVFWTTYFLFKKRYLRIVERPDIYETKKNRKYYRVWSWGTLILFPISTIIGFGIKFGF